MKQENKNSTIRYFIAVQDVKTTNWSTWLKFMRFDFNAERGVEEYYENYPQEATQFFSEDEANAYAFALNYKMNREYCTDYYFVTAIDISKLHDLIRPKEETTTEENQ